MYSEQCDTTLQLHSKLIFSHHIFSRNQANIISKNPKNDLFKIHLRRKLIAGVYQSAGANLVYRTRHMTHHSIVTDNGKQFVGIRTCANSPNK